jgi:hypothetical protein
MIVGSAILDDNLPLVYLLSYRMVLKPNMLGSFMKLRILCHGY